MPCLPGLRPVMKLVQAAALRMLGTEASGPKTPSFMSRAKPGSWPCFAQASINGEIPRRCRRRSLVVLLSCASASSGKRQAYQNGGTETVGGRGTPVTATSPAAATLSGVDGGGGAEGTLDKGGGYGVHIRCRKPLQADRSHGPKKGEQYSYWAETGMSAGYRQALSLSIKAADLLVMVGSFVVAAAVVFLGTSWYSLPRLLTVRLKPGNLLLFLLLMAAWYVVFNAFGLYRSRRLSSVREETLRRREGHFGGQHDRPGRGHAARRHRPRDLFVPGGVLGADRGVHQPRPARPSA